LPFGAKVEFVQDLRNGEYVYTNSSGAFSLQLGRKGKWYFGGGKETITPTDHGDSLGIQHFKAQTFNIEYYGDGRNDRWLPSKGYFWDAKTQIGQVKETNKKDNIIIRLQLHLEQFLVLSRNMSLRFKLWSGIVWDEGQEIHVGQKIRYGGINTLRGYQEDIFANLFAFGDKAYQDVYDIPLSLGFGLRQRTKNSVMEVSFGWPVDEAFSGGKVHVKFTSLLD